MYDELIARLRETSIDFGESDHISVMMIEAADAIEELCVTVRNLVAVIDEWAEELKKHRWIPVTERLPEDGQRVLAISLSKKSPRRSYYSLVYFSNNLESVDNLEFEGESRCGFYYYDSEYGFCEVNDATHWMALPEPPKAKEGE